ncbi:hypothetical protein ES703_120187 [subsurface metagenome]
MAKARKRNVVTPDKLDELALMHALESQGNVIPPAIASVLRLVAPIIARLAIRYVARKARKHISDSAVNTASKWIGDKIQDIILKAEKEG